MTLWGLWFLSLAIQTKGNFLRTELRPIIRYTIKCNVDIVKTFCTKIPWLKYFEECKNGKICLRMAGV